MKPRSPAIHPRSRPPRPGGAPRPPGSGLRAVALFLVLGMVLPAAAGPAAAAEPKRTDEVSLKKSQLRQLHTEQEKVGRQLRQARRSEQEALDKIEHLSETVRVVHGRLKRLAARRARQRAELRKRRAEVGLLSGRIAAGRKEINAHLTRLYRLAKAGDAANLLALARYEDFFKNRVYLASLVRTDQGKVQAYERTLQELAAKQAGLEKSLQDVAAVERKLREERRTLAKNDKSLRASLQEMRKNQRVYQGYLAELERVRLGMENAISAMERGTAPSSGGGPKPEALRGVLPPPVKGVIVAAFGQQDPRYDLKKFQRGIVVRVDPEAPVTAVAPGHVVHAGPFRGYQGLVVLDHGQGLFTVYGHLEELKIARGQQVQTGAVLGTTTFQPVDSAHDLYFEIRVKGKPVDPRKWLRPPGLTLAPQARKG